MRSSSKARKGSPIIDLLTQAAMMAYGNSSENPRQSNDGRSRSGSDDSWVETFESLDSYLSFDSICFKKKKQRTVKKEQKERRFRSQPFDEIHRRNSYVRMTHQNSIVLSADV